jgi:hypothetical protein
MEVHHHAHTSRKKWTHYFWEFLMLFLAVFCGFLAEYQLEHKIEKDREKQLIKSMVADLTQDVLYYSENINALDSNDKRADSLIFLLNSNEIHEYGSQLYYLARVMTRNRPLIVNNRTIQQMKNSGGFRLIRNHRASMAILDYYNRLDFVNFLFDLEKSEVAEYKEILFTVIDPYITDINLNLNDGLLRPPGNPKLISYSRDKLQALTGTAHYIKSTRRAQLREIKAIQSVALSLIHTLEKEYYLK